MLTEIWEKPTETIDPHHNSRQSWTLKQLPWKETAFQNAENWLCTLQINVVFIDLNMGVRKRKLKKQRPKFLSLGVYVVSALGTLPHVSVEKNSH